MLGHGAVAELAVAEYETSVTLSLDSLDASATLGTLTVAVTVTLTSIDASPTLGSLMAAGIDEAPSVVVGQYLINQAVFAAPGGTWPLYFNFLPEFTGVPDNAAAIYDTTGIADGRSMTTGKTLFHHGVQIRVRGATAREAWTKAFAVRDALVPVQNTEVTVNGFLQTITTASLQTQPIALGFDSESHRRFEVVLNYLVTIEEV